MAVLRIARTGNPLLAQVAAPVANPGAPEIRRLAKDMIETLEDIGASGLVIGLPVYCCNLRYSL